MDHSTPLPSAQPWRAAAIVAAAVATVELFILVLIAIAFATRFFAGEVDQAAASALSAGPAVEQQAAAQPGPATQSKKSEPAAKPILPRGETSVIVLNGNGIPGAASIAAQRVHARGYLIAGSTNAPRSDFQQSLIMFRPGLEREARRLAADAGIRRVAPLDGISKRDLQGAHLALILGG